MALEQIQLDGDAARMAVRAVWPNATSAYVAASSAEVYDKDTCITLARVDDCDFAVDQAWCKAARTLYLTAAPEQ